MQVARKAPAVGTICKLHDLSACECGMIVCARYGIAATSETATPEGFPCARVFSELTTDRGCSAAQNKSSMSEIREQLVWFECVQPTIQV